MLLKLRHLGAALAAAGFIALPGAAWSQAAVDVCQAVPDAKAVADGLFPEEECEQLKAAGFKCMGFRPTMRYALPAAAFKVGSAEIPDSMKAQLEVFADVLRGRKGSGKVVRIEEPIYGGANGALWGFLGFYVSCLAITWFVYSRPGGLLHAAERTPRLQPAQ